MSKHCCKKNCCSSPYYYNNEKDCVLTPDGYYGKKDDSVYGEFIRTFTFSDALQLPIVQPGGSIVFPTPTVLPDQVTYVEEEDRVGLSVPRGTYLVTIVLNPSEGAVVELLVNDVKPVTLSLFPYTQFVTTGLLNVSYLVDAPLRRDNLISLKNGGTALFTLGDIPNTKVGNTAVITQIRVQRVGK